mmetsp:Transcript_34422/g.60360  ORF Transcript_34422/g.60360 Transcript_34422/m.60360 type:complete len:97 (-) Transcript_34422:2421-2711(-)
MIGQEDHPTYIHRVINPVMESLVTDLIVHKPADVMLYMSKWLAERHPSTKLSQDEETELRLLKKELKDLKGKDKSSSSSDEGDEKHGKSESKQKKA